MRCTPFVLTLLLACFFATSSRATDQPNILVMAEDASEGTVPRHSRVSQSVVSILQNQLHDRGFNVYDESLVSLHQRPVPAQRSDAQLVAIARSINRPPIDIVIAFRIYASVLAQDDSSLVTARMNGRMLNAQSGKFLGEFNVDTSQPWTAPAQCSSECLAESLNQKASVLAADLGAVLSEKLAALIQTDTTSAPENQQMLGDYYLTFDGFSSADMLEIEEYLVIFSGYHSLRPTEQHYTRTEILYRSASSAAKLNRNLKKMLDELNMRAMVNISANRFTIKRITLRGNDSSSQDTSKW